jgi:hypothetical protein
MDSIYGFVTVSRRKYRIRMWNHSLSHRRNIEIYFTAHKTPRTSLTLGIRYRPIHRSRLTLVIPRLMNLYPPSPPSRTQSKLRMTSLLHPDFGRSVGGFISARRRCKVFMSRGCRTASLDTRLRRQKPSRGGALQERAHC